MQIINSVNIYLIHCAISSGKRKLIPDPCGYQLLH